MGRKKTWCVAHPVRRQSATEVARRSSPQRLAGAWPEPAIRARARPDQNGAWAPTGHPLSRSHGFERFPQMKRNLVTEEVEVHPGVCASAFSATQYLTVKSAGLRQVSDVEREMKQAARGERRRGGERSGGRDFEHAFRIAKLGPQRGIKAPINAPTTAASKRPWCLPPRACGRSFGSGHCHPT